MQPELAKLDHDLHVHTGWSACCADKTHQTPQGILTLAATMGLATLGFADHLWTNQAVPASDWYRPQDERRIAHLRSALAEVPTGGVRALVGCEADTIAPGKFSITAETAQRLDFVLLACSHFHMKDFVAQPVRRTPRGLGEHMLEFFRSAVASGLATSIPHPLLPCGRMEEFDAAIAALSDAELADAFGVAADRGVAIEVTIAFLPTLVNAFSIETPVRFLSIARQAGCKFTFGTDAHAPQDQQRLPQLRRFVEALKLTGEDLLPLATRKQ